VVELRVEILIAGRGGQGILLAGHIIGKSIATYTNLYVLGSETYGAETRGGDTRTDLIVADEEEEADFVKVMEADIALVMNQTQLNSYGSLIKDGALVFLDKSNVYSIPQRSWRVFLEPYTDIAEKEYGTTRVANMVALGHLVKQTSLISAEAVEKVIRETVSKDWVDVNIRAFRHFLSR
jgi:2-oxoglutarate ferredoxin oxidoreductase subunit gamma